MIDKIYRWAVPVLALWLLLWIRLSWPGVQDDAFIHLRYADNLYRIHLVTYDGVHPSYGASSLLYIYLLSFLRAITASPNLPRVVSSVVHLLLFTGLVLLFLRAVPRQSHLGRLLALSALLLLVSPSAVRWLDDGMETGLGLCFTALICWIIFYQSRNGPLTKLQFMAFVVAGFLAVLLRIELILLCGLAFVILAWQRISEGPRPYGISGWMKTLASRSHLLLGGILALASIRIKMHDLLPDTALAKSSGHADWGVTLYVTAKVLVGALSFGVGLLVFWLLTVFFLLRARRFTMTALFANSVFPILLALAAQRGQQVQGARYFAWTLCFSILWNILQLGQISPSVEDRPRQRLAWAFLVVLLLAMPYESMVLYPMLKSRAALSQQFESQHFEYLKDSRGVASDIGLIGYFSHADICDLQGLVNGREKARETETQRIAGCIAGNPDFLFFDEGTIWQLGSYIARSDWQLCSSSYNFKNVNSSDRHYLVVRRSIAAKVCSEVSNSVPADVKEAVQ